MMADLQRRRIDSAQCDRRPSNRHSAAGAAVGLCLEVLRHSPPVATKDWEKHPLWLTSSGITAVSSI
jgi:hypothetical protein